MKKAITVFEGNNFSEAAINFIAQYPSVKKPLLVGIFLSSIDYSSAIGYPISMAGYISPIIEDVKTVARNIKRFTELCEKHGIEYKIHKNAGANALDILKEETMFADVLIVSSELFYKHIGGKQPGEYMRRTLRTAECPIILLPENFNLPTKVILTYDGSESSIYAIKQFSYVLPELRGHKTMLVYASATESDIPELGTMEELTRRHFTDLSIHKLDLDGKKYFNTWLMDEKNAIVITGGYAQNGLEALFHKSFITETIADHKMPVFIAHK
jgi:hypothetical protein